MRTITINNIQYFIGFIYILKNSNCKDRYVGSTTTSVKKRYNDHKYDFNNNSGRCKSKILFERGPVKYRLVETVYFKNKKELLLRESYYMDKYRNKNYIVVNEQHQHGKYAGLTRSEIGTLQAKLHLKTKINCICGKQTNKLNKARHERSQFHQNYINSL